MKLSEKIRIVVALIGACLILSVPAWAVINRIVGGNIIAGDGLKLGTNDPDTMHVLVGWGHQLDNDTTKPNITQIWTDSLWGMLFAMIETTDAVIDSAIGAERAATALVADSALAFTHDGIKDWHIDWGSGAGQVNLADVPQTAWRVFYSNTSGVITELALGADGTYLKSNGAAAAPTFATPPGGDPGSAIHDSLYANAPGYITKYTQFWPDNPAGMAISWGTVDVDVYFPVSEKFGDITHPYFVRSVTRGTADDKLDTVTFSGRLPLGFDADIDSITLPHRTSTTTAANASVTWQIFAMADLTGFPTADTMKVNGVAEASASAGVWEWLSIPFADSTQQIGAGSWIFVYAICGLDYTTHAETVDVATPLFWGSAK